jgi:hypothetical protein
MKSSFFFTAFSFLLIVATLIYVGANSLLPRKSESNSVAANGKPALESENTTPLVQNPVMVAATIPTTTGDDPFFIFNNGSETDFFQGKQFFGTQDKVGVNSNIMTNYSNQIDDFVFIGSKNTDREQFLAANGNAVTAPNRLWRVLVTEAGIVGGDVRVNVFTTVGADKLENNGYRMAVDGKVDEIWKLDLNGTNPVLLERSTTFHHGISTHLESPPIILPPGDNISFGKD